MKKQIIIALAFSVSAFSFAQKKELKTAEKAIKNLKYAEAKTALKQAEGLMSAMDDKSKAKYYLLNGQALYAGGAASIEESDKSLESLNKAEDVYTVEVKQLKQDIANNFIKKGNASYEKEDYSISSKFFEKAYRLREKDTLFLYYAAATAVSVKEYDRALLIYEELKDLGYTGITTQYIAINKETEKEEVFDNKSMRDVSVKAKTHIKPSEKVTKSKKPEILKNIALIYISHDQSDKAISAMEEARAENPDDVSLILTEANVHYKLGDTEKFKSLLEKATQMEPNNAELQYNLGVIASESGEFDQAKAYYERAIEIDSNYINSYINMAALILGKESAMIEEMNGLGSSSADDKRYDELKTQRQELYKDAIPYLTKALDIDSENLSAAKTLMNIYSILGEADKYKDLKAKVETLEGEG